MFSKLKFWQPHQLYQSFEHKSYFHVGITTFRSASLFDNIKGSKPRKTCNFIKFLLIFLLTRSKLKFWQPLQISQPCRPTAEVLRLLPSTLFHCLITKRTQNQEKRAYLLVNSNSDSHVNCTSHVDLDMRFWDKRINLASICSHKNSIKCELLDIQITIIWDLYGYQLYGLSKAFTLGSALLSSLPIQISRCFHKKFNCFNLYKDFVYQVIYLPYYDIVCLPIFGFIVRSRVISKCNFLF